MKRLLVLTVFATLTVAACEKKDDATMNVPGPNGLMPDGSPPQSPPPQPPNPGTYYGRANGNPLPPLSGLNSDPANPSGAPGTYSPTTIR